MSMITQAGVPAQVEPLTTFEQNCLTTLATITDWLHACQQGMVFVVSPMTFLERASAIELHVMGILAQAALPYASILTDEGKARILATWGPCEEEARDE